MLKKYTSSNKLISILVITAICLCILTYYDITKESRVLGPDPSSVIGWILADLIVFLTLGILLTKKVFKKRFIHKTKDNTSLQDRIILAFSLVAAIPTIIVAIFSTYFFHFGIQSWFDKKVSTVLDQSSIVAESYVAEHTLQLKETALSLADDLSNMYYDLIYNPQLFHKTLNAEAEMRSLNEAIVFQKNTNTIIAQTSFSFLLSFTAISVHSFAKADAGEIVEVKSDPTKIRILLKLKEYDDTYLLIGRLIDEKIIDHIDKTNGASAEYNRLKTRILSMQIKFSIVFIFIALLLLLAAISWGAIIASQIVKPIRKLVSATDKVKKGDLTVQVPEQTKNMDEITILSSAFNRMIKQLNQQQQDLVTAQRALAWSDVARRVAHEINNPLTPIQLSAERLIRKFEHEVSDKVAFNRYISTITNNIRDIQTIVSEFVNFARLPSPIFVSCNIIPLIKDIVESRKLVHDKIAYSFHCEDGAIDFVCDITQMNQIMLNLLKNSEEALESIISPAINIVVEKLTKFLYITVSDNGSGFSADNIHKVTEAYFTTRAKGTGLGLAIVKKIIQDHFGTLELSNKEGGGALIKLTFDIGELSSKLK